MMMVINNNEGFGDKLVARNPRRNYENIGCSMTHKQIPHPRVHPNTGSPLDTNLELVQRNGNLIKLGQVQVVHLLGRWEPHNK